MQSAVPLLADARALDGPLAHAQRLLADWDVEARLVRASGQGDIARLAVSLAEEGVERLLVLGGQAAWSEAVDAVLRAGAGPEIGLLPAGHDTAFLRDFSLDSMERAVSRVAAGEARAFDVALVRRGSEERHVLAGLATGLLSRLVGRSGAMSAWSELARPQAGVVRLTLDGLRVEDTFLGVAVCNAVHAVGAWRVAPLARLDDGWLDVVALRDVGRAKLAGVLHRMDQGEHLADEEVFHVQARRIRLEPVDAQPLVADGVPWGATPVDVMLLPGALRLLV